MKLSTRNAAFPKRPGMKLLLSIPWLPLLALIALLVPSALTAQPNLTISKIAPATVAPFANLTYTITYGNTGDADATGVQIADTLPVGTTFVSATGGGILINSTVVWAIGTVPAGATGLTVDLTVQNTQVSGTVDNVSYNISAPGLPVVPGPAVSTQIVAPTLTISKTAPATVATGTNLTYTITYGNPSGVDAPFVSIADTIPAGTVFVSATGGGGVDNNVVDWAIGTVPAGASGLTVSFTVQVTALSGTVDNLTYSISAPGVPAFPGQPVSTQIVNLSIAKSAPATVLPGADLTYTISYANAAAVAILGVSIADRVPVGTTFVSASNGGTLTNGTVTWIIGDLAPNASGTVSLTVNVAATSGTVDNTTYEIDGSQQVPVAGAPVSTGICTIPVAVASADQTSICPGSVTRLHGSGGNICSWTPSAWLSNPNFCNPTVTPTGNGSITYTLRVRDSSCGLQSTNNPTVTITATDKPAGPAVDAPAEATAGETGLVASVVNPRPGSAYSFAFTPPSGAAVTSQSPSSIVFTALIVPLTLQVIETSGACVSDPTQIVITPTIACVDPQPPPTALIQAAGNPGGPVTGVDYLDLSWTAPEIPPKLYLWSLNGALPQEEATTSVPNQPPTGNNDSITLQVRGACSDSVFSDPTVTTVSPSPPEAQFSVAPSVGAGIPVTFTDTSDPDATSWLWLFGDGTDASTDQSVTHTFASVGTYTVFLIASNGAGSSSTSHPIEVTSEAAAAARRILQSLAFDASNPERQRLNGIDLPGAGGRWLQVRSLEQTEAILFLRFLNPTGVVALERRLSISPGQDAAFDLTAYGLEGTYDLELVALRHITASLVAPLDRRPREVRREQR